jgi:hypothetical protein
VLVDPLDEHEDDLPQPSAPALYRQAMTYGIDEAGSKDEPSADGVQRHGTRGGANPRRIDQVGNGTA